MGFFSKKKSKHALTNVVVSSVFGLCLLRPDVIAVQRDSGIVCAVRHGVGFCEFVGKDGIIWEVAIDCNHTWSEVRFIDDSSKVVLLSPMQLLIIDFVTTEEYFRCSPRGSDITAAEGATLLFTTMLSPPAMPFLVIGQSNGTVVFFNWISLEWSQYSVSPFVLTNTAQPVEEGQGRMETAPSTSPLAVRTMAFYPCDPNTFVVVIPSLPIVKCYLTEKRSSSCFRVPPGEEVTCVTMSETGAVIIAGCATGGLIVWMEKDRDSKTRNVPVRKKFHPFPPEGDCSIKLLSLSNATGDKQGDYSTLNVVQDSPEGVRMFTLEISLKDCAVRNVITIPLLVKLSSLEPILPSVWKGANCPPTQYIGRRFDNGEAVLLLATKEGLAESSKLRPLTPWGSPSNQQCPPSCSCSGACSCTSTSLWIVPQRNPRLLGIARQGDPNHWPHCAEGDTPFDMEHLSMDGIDRPYALGLLHQGKLSLSRLSPFRHELIRGGGGVFEDPRYDGVAAADVTSCGMLMAALRNVDDDVMPEKRRCLVMLFDFVSLSTNCLDITSHSPGDGTPCHIVLVENFSLENGVATTAAVVVYDDNSILVLCLASRMVTCRISGHLFPAGTTILSTQIIRVAEAKMPAEGCWTLLCFLSDGRRVMVIDLRSQAVSCKTTDKPFVAPPNSSNFHCTVHRSTVPLHITQRDDLPQTVECGTLSEVPPEVTQLNTKLSLALAFSMGFGFELIFPTPLHPSPHEAPDSIAADKVRILCEFSLFSPLGALVVRMTIGEQISNDDATGSAIPPPLYASVSTPRSFLSVVDGTPDETHFESRWMLLNPPVEEDFLTVGLRLGRDVASGSLTMFRLTLAMDEDSCVPPSVLHETSEPDLLIADSVGMCNNGDPNGIVENGVLVDLIAFTTPVEHRSRLSVHPQLQWPMQQPTGPSKSASYFALVDESGFERLHSVWLSPPKGAVTSPARDVVIQTVAPSTIAVTPAVEFTTPAPNLKFPALLDVRSLKVQCHSDAKALKEAVVEDIVPCCLGDDDSVAVVVTSRPFMVLLIGTKYLELMACSPIDLRGLDEGQLTSLKAAVKSICGQLHVIVSFSLSEIGTNEVVQVVFERADAEDERQKEKGELQGPLFSNWLSSPLRHNKPLLHKCTGKPFFNHEQYVEAGPAKCSEALLSRLPPPPNLATAKDTGFFKSLVAKSYVEQLKRVVELLTPSRPKESFSDFTTRLAKNPNLSQTEREELLSGVPSRASRGPQGANSKTAAVNEEMSNAKNAMAENLDALSERGERINRLEEKSNWMEKESAEFEDLCRQLKEKKRKSWWL